MQAALRGRPQRGEQVLVLGCGPVGLLTTLHLSSLGVQVVAADVSAERSAFARHFGAAATVVVGDAPMPAEPPLVIEASGAPAAFDLAVETVATAGRVVLLGISDRRVTLSMRTLPVKDLDLLGTRNSQRRMGQALELLAFHPEAATALLTHQFPLERVADAFELLGSAQGLVGKVAINFSRGTAGTATSIAADLAEEQR